MSEANNHHYNAFLEFDRLNPTVYTRLESTVKKLHAGGLKRFGLGRAYEELRYESAATVGDTFKLNNNWRKYYSLKIVQNNPDLASVLVTREEKAATA